MESLLGADCLVLLLLQPLKGCVVVQLMPAPYTSIVFVCLMIT